MIDILLLQVLVFVFAEVLPILFSLQNAVLGSLDRRTAVLDTSNSPVSDYGGVIVGWDEMG